MKRLPKWKTCKYCGGKKKIVIGNNIHGWTVRFVVICNNNPLNNKPCNAAIGYCGKCKRYEQKTVEDKSVK